MGIGDTGWGESTGNGGGLPGAAGRRLRANQAEANTREGTFVDYRACMKAFLGSEWKMGRFLTGRSGCLLGGCGWGYSLLTALDICRVKWEVCEVRRVSPSSSTTFPTVRTEIKIGV